MLIASQRHIKGSHELSQLQLPGGSIVQLVVADAHKQFAVRNASVLIPTSETGCASTLSVLVGTTVLRDLVRSVVDASEDLLEPRHTTAISFRVERRSLPQDPTGMGSSASMRPTNRLARSTHSIASLP